MHRTTVSRLTHDPHGVRRSHFSFRRLHSAHTWVHSAALLIMYLCEGDARRLSASAPGAVRPPRCSSRRHSWAGHGSGRRAAAAAPWRAALSSQFAVKGSGNGKMGCDGIRPLYAILPSHPKRNAATAHSARPIRRGGSSLWAAPDAPALRDLDEIEIKR